MAKKTSASEKKVRQIRRKSRKQYSGEEKIRIVLDGLHSEESASELCRREGITESMYYRWSKEFLEAGKARLVGNTKRQATSDEALASLTLLFQRAVPLRSLNSLPQQRQRRNRILSLP